MEIMLVVGMLLKCVTRYWEGDGAAAIKRYAWVEKPTLLKLKCCL